MTNKDIFNLSYNQTNPNVNKLIAQTFNDITKDDIRVGYIDPVDGYVTNVTICEANDYAQKNPATRFVFRNGDNNILYLGINDVNKLTPKDLIPKNECGGLQSQYNCNQPPSIQIFGGGGVGALANPVIGADGSLLAVDVVKGGYGYQYAPQVKVVDKCNIGTGAVATVELGNIVEVEEIYENELEEYEICTPDDIEYGTIYGPNGEELGEWNPEIYTNIDQNDITVNVENYQQQLLKFKNPFWTTRKNKPYSVVSADKKIYAQVYSVGIASTSAATNGVDNSIYWNDFMKSYAISPVSPSNVPGSDQANNLFIMEWDAEFPYDGQYIFRGSCDGTVGKVYLDNEFIFDLGGYKDVPVKFITTIKNGIHNLRIDLLNNTLELANSTIFNTVDYISKANRKLWRINSGGGTGLINQYGVLPFDPNSPEAQNDPFSGTHTIIWDNINFPVDGDYTVNIAVDDNVTLYIGDTIIRKEGFYPGTSTALPDLNQKYFFKAGNYTIRADLEQIPGNALGKRNPMALAVDIKSPSNANLVVSTKSWFENPLGAALTIDAPEPPVPQQKLPVQEGSCPPNPIWSTRFPGATEQWYPVRYTKNNSWSNFMNRYAISPIKPLDTPGSDKAGVTYKNSWTVDIPYNGYYGVKGTRDNRGRLLIDGNEVSKLDGFRINNPKITKVYLTKGEHTIDVEVYNTPQGTSNIIDQKIFSTQDWQTKLQATQQVQNIAGIAQREEWVLSADIYDPPRTFHQYLRGTWYNGVSYRSGGDWNDTNPYSNYIQVDENTRIVLGSYKGSDFGIAVYKKVIVDVPTTSQIIRPVTSIDNDQYSGPPLFNHKDKRWSDFMNTYSVSPKVFNNASDYDLAINGKFTMVWKNINFPEDGEYDIRFLSDNIGSLSIGDKVIAASESYGTDPTIKKVTLNKGTYKLTIELTNIEDTRENTTFAKNPMGVALYITKKVDIGDLNKKTWYDNPVGISAVLIPPPCPKKISGRGVISRIVVTEPGNGYYPPSSNSSQGYPATLQLTDIIVTNPGINYNCGVDQLKIIPDNGTKVSYTCNPFGVITGVTVDTPGIGFTEYPTIYMETETGVNFSAIPVFSVIRDPIDITGITTSKILQVTDLVGLKQTGYVNGRAYYGAVYYDNGIRYAGYYKTAGTPIQVYDTLQESINAQVTTPPSAIERSGTDIRSNNPNLNIPGTPQNTTEL